MRILLTTPDYSPRSGGIQLLCERLASESRFQYEVVTRGQPDERQPSAAEPAVTRAPTISRNRPAVAVLNVLTLRIALSTRPDATVSGHLVTGPAALAAQRVLGIPAIQYLHSAEVAERPHLARALTKRSAASIAVSSYTRRHALSLGAPAERLHVVHPGVDEGAVAQCRDGVDGRAVQPTVVTVARLEDRYKGFDVMVRALASVRVRVPDARWVIVGEGSLREEIESMAARSGVREAISFTGAVDDAARDEWLDRAHVFAMPSRLMPGGVGGEGFGIVYLEAAAHGLPCVAGNVGGAVDAVLDGETGLTVDPTDHAAVADAIATLLLEPELRARLGEAGRARASRMTWARMAEQVDDLVESLVAASR